MTSPSNSIGAQVPPNFSIVIPAHDAVRTIGATLASVLAQTRSDFEVVVVDDGSKDGTAESVEAIADPRVRVVRQRCLGPSAARNAGIAATGGPKVSFLDADDLWYPTYLDAMGKALDQQPRAGLAFTDAWVWHQAVGRFGRRTIMAPVPLPEGIPIDPTEFFRVLVERNVVFSSATVPRSVLERVGGFDESLRASEDWELWMRIAAHGYAAIRLGPVLAVYRVHAGSVSSNIPAMQAGEREALQRVSRYALDEELAARLEARRQSLVPIDGRSSSSLRDPPRRERLTRHLPSFLRPRTFRKRAPSDLPPAMHALLRSGVVGARS